MIIESTNNPKVKEWMKLKEKKYRDISNEFIIEGDHLIKEALNKGLIKEVIALDKKWEISNLPFYEVNEKIMKKISSQVTSTQVMAICKKIEETEIQGRVCILDNIQDPGNLGTILRSAVAFKIDTIIMSQDTVDLYNEKVIRASEGMIFNINYQKRVLTDVIKELKTKGYRIYGTNVNKGTNLKEIDFKNNTAIIIGNEGKGMNDNLIPLCDQLINIKISSKCESLNAGVAASIIFYKMGE